MLISVSQNIFFSLVSNNSNCVLDLTGVILSHSFHQDVDVDFEPLLLALAGLCAFLPVIWIHSIFHPVLCGNFLLVVTVKVVDHLVIQHTHGCELVDARRVHRFGEGRVDVSEGMLL